MSEDQNTDNAVYKQKANQSSNQWERGVLEKLVMSTLKEQQSARRWGIFFKMLFLGYLIALLAVSLGPFSGEPFGKSENHTAVVDIKGTIFEGSEADARKINQGLRAAVKHERTKGIILRMNTPGGTPVQSAYVYDEIRKIKKEHPELPIYAVVSDMCASGGYFIASAADKIFVNRSSIIGSIGVLMNGFGFVDTMKKFGIERRLLIAGENKALMDAFSPVREDDKKHVQTLLDDIHKHFITAVREGRGERLSDESSIYTGLVWTGDKSIELGLADDFGTTNSVAKDLIGEEKLVNFTPKENWIDRFAGRIGTGITKLWWQTATNLGSSIL